MKRTRVRSWTLVVAGSLIIGGVLTGCGGGSSSDTSTAQGTDPSSGVGSSGSVGSTSGAGSTANTGSTSGGTSSSSSAPSTAGVSPTQKPTIQGTAPTTATVGQAYSFQPQASGGAGALSFTVANKPAWAAFSASTGQLSGTPAATDVGTASSVEISVTDGASVVSLPAFNITVAAAPASQTAAAGTVTLSWQPPTENTDGTPITTLAGYNIYYGTAPQTYTSTIKVSNPGLATYVVQSLPAGKYYFAVSAYDSSGAESDYSQEVSATVN